MNGANQGNGWDHELQARLLSQMHFIEIEILFLFVIADGLHSINPLVFGPERYFFNDRGGTELSGDEAFFELIHLLLWKLMNLIFKRLLPVFLSFPGI